MRYTGINSILEGQLEEGTCNEEIIKNRSKADPIIHTYAIFKIFYIFLIGSIFGCYMEQIRYLIQRNIWECRAGVIWGPFSEIYGIGAVIMYLLYKKMVGSSPITIFCISTVCGSAFEYISRLFQEIAFHSITWDYSKQPFNLGGRTSLKFAVCWGLLGLIFIRWVFPLLDKYLNNIRGRFVSICTWFLIIFMTVNLMFSAIAVNRWSERLQGVPSNGYIESYMDNHYDNDEMKQRFPHLRFLAASANVSTKVN